MPLSVMVMKQPDGLNCLPDEVLRKILQLLSLDSLLSCERVCRRWQSLVLDNALWARHLVVHSENPGHEQNNLHLISSHGQYVSLLTLKYVKDYFTTKYILECCGNVTALQLVRCKLDQQFETDLEKCINLQKLDISTCDLGDESSDSSMHFNNFKDLSFVSLSNFGLNYSNCDTLLQCRHLTHVYIERIKHLNVQYMKQLIASKQRILKALHIDGGNAVDDKCLQLLSQCEHLQDLAIAHCQNLTDDGLVTISNLRKLEQLKIRNSLKFSEICLLSMFRSDSLRSLRSLDLSGVENVSSSVVDVITECCTNVRSLTLYRCPKLVGCERYLDIKLRNLTIALY